jgi:hypothetical protein
MLLAKSKQTGKQTGKQTSKQETKNNNSTTLTSINAIDAAKKLEFSLNNINFHLNQSVKIILVAKNTYLFKYI